MKEHRATLNLSHAFQKIPRLPCKYAKFHVPLDISLPRGPQTLRELRNVAQISKSNSTQLLNKFDAQLKLQLPNAKHGDVTLGAESNKLLGLYSTQKGESIYLTSYHMYRIRMDWNASKTVQIICHIKGKAGRTSHAKTDGENRKGAADKQV